MGVFTHVLADCTSQVAPGRLFQAICIDSPTFLPKVLPQFIKSVEFLVGDSTSVGCHKLIKLADGRFFTYLIARVDEIDEGNMYYKYTTIGGDVLGDNLECVVYEYKFKHVGNGSHFKLIAHFHTKGDYVLTQAEAIGAKQAIDEMFKPTEVYLTANPQVYVSEILSRI